MARAKKSLTRHGLRIGISGWTYTAGAASFTPKGLAHGASSNTPSRQINSIEINGSFYALQRPSCYQRLVRANAAPASSSP